MAVTQDLRHAARNLARSPGFTGAAILALALGIGGSAAIFSLVNAVMLRSLPYPALDRLYLAHLKVTGGPAIGPQRMPWSYPKWQTFRDIDTSFESLAGFTEDSFNLTSGGEAERVQAEMVSPSYFGMLGQAPLLGALFPADAERPDGGARVALVSEGLWRRRFGADPAAIGRTVELDKKQLTLIGVMPAAFRGLTGKADVWVPLSAAGYLWYPQALTEEGNHWFDAIGRLRPGITEQGLAAAMTAAGERIDAAHPNPPEFKGDSVWSAGATSLVAAREDARLRRALLVLLGAVGAVLLIACANLGNLLLVRAGTRRREMAVRAALGASRGRLMRQLLAESLLLAGTGGAAGMLVAQWMLRGLAALRPETLSGWGVSASEGLDLAAASIDGRVLAFGVGLALLVGVATGLVPALRASRRGLVGALKEGGAVIGGARGRSRAWGRGALVAGELAVALVLLAGAGLLLRSFAKLSHLDLNFTPEHMLTAEFNPAQGDYTREAALQLHADMAARIGAIPGVTAVSLATCGPLTDSCNGTLLTRLDGKEVPRSETVRVGAQFVSPGHLQTIGAHLLAGREFTAADRSGAPRVLMVSAALAERLWPGQSPLGHHLAPGQGGFEKAEQGEVVGVVADLRYRSLEDAPVFDVYLPERQAFPNARMLFVRTAGDPLAVLPAVRAAVHSIDPTLPLYGVRTMEERLGDSLSRARFAAFLLALFAGLALLLAAIGVYGVLAYAVHERRREIGVRVALGARRADIAGLVVRQGMTLAVCGALAGGVAAWAASGVLRGLLYGVEPQDPAIFAAGPLVLLLSALAACLLPARKAARVDPMRVLREE